MSSEQVASPEVESNGEPSPEMQPAAVSSSGVKIGRPSKCTPEVIERICTEVARGMPKKYAGALLGIHYTTLHEWEERGSRDEEPFATFARALAIARSQHIAMRLQAIESGEGDWKRQAWLLERLEPTTFGPTSRTQVTGADGGPVQMAAQVVVVPAVTSSADDWAATVSRELTADGDEQA